MHKFGAALLSAALLFSPPLAPIAHATPCGTIVIPDSIGQSDPGAVTGLNPLVSSSLYNTQSRILLYRPLIWPSQADTADPDRSLATTVEALDNNTRYRVTLKPWLWSDGKPVTADDVLFCWELIEKLGPIFQAVDQGGVPDRIKTVTVIDDSHIDFILTAPVNPEWFELNGLSEIYALPRHAWGNIGRDEMWRRQTDPRLFAVVDGPFKLQDLKLDRYIAFTPNPLYGGHKSTLRRLVVDFLEGSSALHALQAGEVDMAHVPFQLFDQLGRLPHDRIIDLPQSFGYRPFVMNLKNDATRYFRDVRVRQALADATDQRTIVDLVYHGYSEVSHLPIPVDPPTYLSPAARAHALPVKFDPAHARALLDQAGWRPGPDGVRENGGLRMSFATVVSVEAPDRIEELQILQQNLRDIGVDMRIEPVTFSQLLATLFGPPGGWDAVVLSYTLAGFPDGTTYFDTGGANNSGGYSDPTMDKLIAASVTQPGREALFAYEDYLATQQPWNFLPEGRYPLMIAPGVQGVEDFTNAQGYWSPEYLYLTGSRACHG